MTKKMLFGAIAITSGCVFSPQNSGNGRSRSEEALVTTLPCDVDAVIDRKCRSCHSADPKYGAPMPLVTAGDFDGVVRELVRRRIADPTSPMPPRSSPSLTASERATLDAWLATGAASGRCTPDASAPPDDIVGRTQCTPDVHLRGRRPATVAGRAENVSTCFGVDVATAEKRHVIGFAPRVSNARVVHHMFLMRSTKAEDPEPHPCDASALLDHVLISGWAPGQEAFELPPEAGFPVQGETHWVVQIHYENGARDEAQTDDSGFDLCTTPELRPNDAASVLIGSTPDFVIPARGRLDWTCDWQLPASFPKLHVFAAWPHMHLHGREITLSRLLQGDGSKVQTIAEAVPYDFEQQRLLATSAELQPGDVARTRCVWENPTREPVGFGQGTSDEMCNTYVAYWPALPDGQLPWVDGSALSRCRQTPIAPAAL